MRMYNKNRYGLVGHWAMNGNAKDSTINKNDGVVTGASLTTDRFGRANRAYEFDGINDKYITIPDSSALQFDENTPATFSLWLNLRAFTQSGYLFMKIHDNNNHYGLYTLVNGKFIFTTRVAGDYSSIVLGAGTYDKLNEWAHVVIRVGRTPETNAIFINGVSKTLDSNSITNQTMTHSGNLYIGKNAVVTTYSNALISDFRIYNRALSNAEILQLYRSF